MNVRTTENIGSHAGETVDFEGNVYLLAEQDELDQLLHRLAEAVGHATRPVDEHDESVILTFADDGVLAEHVFGPLVVHHLNGIEDTRLRGHGTLVSVCLLLHLETLGENVHD